MRFWTQKRITAENLLDLGRCGCRWEGNIKWYRKDTGCALDSSAQDRGCWRVRERGNKSSGSIKRRVFLDQLSECQLLKKDSVLWSEPKPYVFLILTCEMAVSCIHSTIFLLSFPSVAGWNFGTVF